MMVCDKEDLINQFGWYRDQTFVPSTYIISAWDFYIQGVDFMISDWQWEIGRSES